MAHLGEKLKEYRTEKGWNQAQLADFIGIGFRTYQEIEKNGIVKKSDVLAKISAKTGINTQIFSHETSLQETDEHYNTPPEVTIIDTNAGAKDYLSKRREKKNSGGPYMVPLVPVAAQAGYAKNFYDIAYIEKLDTYPILPGVDPHGASWRYFQVQGDSMMDTLMNDQFILTSQVIKEDWRNVETSYIYVIITNDGVVVKRLYKIKGKDYWAAVSDNPDETKYPQFKVYVKDVLELWKFRRKVDWHAPSPRKVEIKV